MEHKDLLELLELPDMKFRGSVCEICKKNKWFERKDFVWEISCYSLADIAFRLKDEGNSELYVEALRSVYEYWIEKRTEEHPDLCLVSFSYWGAAYITSTDMIVAALIARRLAGDK